MRRVGILIVLPLLLIGLERVNLIKDHSFEKDSEVWHTRLGGTGFPNFVAIVKRHDSANAYSRSFSGSGDNRPKPSNTWSKYNENTYLTQGFIGSKVLTDIDSLSLAFSIISRNNRFEELFCAGIYLHLNAHKENYWKVGFFLKAEDLPSGVSPPLVHLKGISFSEDTMWHLLEKSIFNDIDEYELESIPQDATLDSVILQGISNHWVDGWRGQKVFWDDVRLMGYADYDVGVKEILEGIEDTSGYTPFAHINNFGREPADFAVVAEILQGETQVYKDSFDWSLPSDTEDTVSFSTFTPPDTGIYTLRIYTVMEPDESDADDEKTKELHFTAISEPVTPIILLDLKVNPICTRGVLKVSFETPKGQVVNLTLFDCSGRRVGAKQVRGYGLAEFGSELSAGVYLVRLQSGSLEVKRKVVVVE
ncbi:T9SS type A sorting domain-containing protein [candidate division WOR-3 bacterium]|uniref:T9SS type A sorting domain-containing protein n=1 Tax=candidate division WOR-3 bacterium TaxID=2052148 RepID=A0A9D5KAT5_UNCW3|nr:T9SS type A sorting domain-containing protein [candidate division WOR-3 bacterium]MBD3364789.1 T9SS type A sorting domain-containing protein [candidate division WOR-3 bacterium]